MQDINQNPHCIVSADGSKVAIQYTNECIHIRNDNFYLGTLDMAFDDCPLVGCGNQSKLIMLIDSRIKAHAAPPMYTAEMNLHADPRITHNAHTDDMLISHYVAHPAALLSLYKSYTNIVNIQRAGLVMEFADTSMHCPPDTQLGMAPIIEGAPTLVHQPTLTKAQLDILATYGIIYMHGAITTRTNIYLDHIYYTGDIVKKGYEKIFYMTIEEILTASHIRRVGTRIMYRNITVIELPLAPQL